MNLDRLEAAEKIESLLALKYDRDFYMTGKSWSDYLESIGCFSDPHYSFFKVVDPESFHKRGGLTFVRIPEEFAFKVLVLGEFP
jgi:hypothetical protein